MTTLLKTEEKKEAPSTPKPKPSRPLPYDVYDKKVYAAKRRSHFITFGYLRNEQTALNVDLPHDLINIMFTFYYNDKIKELLRELPKIQEAQSELFIEKLALCHTVLDFSVDDLEATYELAKQQKTNFLKEITDFIAEKPWISDTTLPAMIDMISCNLFRSLPHNISPYINSLSFVNDDDDDVVTINVQPYENPAWAHLQLVYDIAWRVMNTKQFTAEMMQQQLTKAFLFNLVQLFASQHQRERQYLMMILHTIYGRCLALRVEILKMMSDYLYQVIYGDRFKIYGVVELLQIISAIMPGLKVPVKPVWQELLRNVLVPLFKSYALKMFYEQLIQCCVTYVEKDMNGADVILNGLLRFWPKQSPQKEEIFIMATVNIINALVITHGRAFLYKPHEKILILVIDKLAQCMLSTRKTVAQRAIDVFKETSIQRLIDYDRHALLSKTLKAFYRNNMDRDHQREPTLRQSSKEVEKIYREKDRKYFKKMREYFGRQDKKERKSANAVAEAEMKNEDPYVGIKQKLATKYKYKAKKLTNAEKYAKRRHYWRKIEAAARVNKQKFYT